MTWTTLPKEVEKIIKCLEWIERRLTEIEDKVKTLETVANSTHYERRET